MDIAYQTLRAIALCNNYNIWLFDLLKPYLGKEILEIGCGIGNLTYYFKNDRKFVAIDKEPKYISYIKLDFADVEVYDCDIVDPKILHEKNYTFNSVICINVLEHIKEDDKALSNMYDLTKKNGNAILVVPAHRFLYGELDKNVEHWRRYTKKELTGKIIRAGYTIKDAFYFNRIGAIGWFVNSKIIKRKKISFVQLLLFDKIVFLLRKIDRLFNLPFGISLIIIAEKK